MAETDDSLDPKKRDPLDDNLGMGPVRVAAPSGTPGMIGVPPIARPIYSQPMTSTSPLSPAPPTADKTPMGASAETMNPHIGEANRMQQEGSGVSQVQAKHPFWGGVLRGLDVAGSIFNPNITAAIPGTTLHHNQLIRQQEGLANQDLAQQHEQAQTAEIQQKPQMEQTVLKHQDDLEAQKEAARQAQQVQAQKEQQDRLDQTLGQQQDRADQQQQLSEQHEKDAEARQAAQFAEHEKLADKRAARTGDIGTWSLQEDPQTGKTVLFNSKTGEKRDAPAGVAPKGTFAKTMAPTEDAKNYATDYMQKAIFTGPGDEALQEKFFELAKPSMGFRMTQPQITQLQQSRNWMNSVEGKFYHAVHGAWFPPEQRQQIVDTMNQIATAKEQTRGGAPGGAPTPGGGGMVNMTAPDGTTKPVPADQVEHYKSLGAKVAQ